MASVLSSCSDEWLREQYVERGRSQNSIARELGVSYYIIRRMLSEAGVQFRTPKRYTELRDPKWLREHAHLSALEMAELLGCHVQLVRQYLKDHDMGNMHIPRSALKRAVQRYLDRELLHWDEMIETAKAQRDTCDGRILKRELGFLPYSYPMIQTNTAAYWCRLFGIDFHDVTDENGVVLL